jgi:hypothetical protein
MGHLRLKQRCSSSKAQIIKHRYVLEFTKVNCSSIYIIIILIYELILAVSVHWSVVGVGILKASLFANPHLFSLSTLGHDFEGV